MFRNLVDMHIPSGEGYLNSWNSEAVKRHLYGKGACIYSCAPMEQGKVDGTVDVLNVTTIEK